VDPTQPSPIAPEAWRRMLDALDAGAPPHAACRYAGISLATWERERQRIPEFGVEADRVEASGLVAAWRFLQLAAASEWRGALEYVRLHNATHGRDAVQIDGLDDGPDTEVTPDDVAAVIRVLRAHELGADGANGHAKGRHAVGSNGTG
jgi:hypothetical protein